MFLSGEGIYNNFQQGQGGEKLSSAAALVNELSKLYNEQADEIKKLVGETEAVWKGGASGAAQRGLGPLAVEHALAAPALSSAQDLTNRQVGSFDDAKNRVIPVPPAPEKVDPLAAFMNPGAMVTYGEQLGAHKAAAQHNVDVMRGYENASVYNMNMPQSYGQITGDQSEIRVATATPVNPGGGGESGGPGSGRDNPNPPDGGNQPGGSGFGPAGGGGSAAGGGPAGPGTSGGGGAAVVGSPPQGTTPSGHVPPPAPPVGVPGGGTGAPVGGVPQGGPGSGYLGSVIGPLGGSDVGAGSGGRGGSGAGAGLGAGGRGPGSGSPGAGGPGAGGPGVGGRPGVGPVGEPIAGQSAGARSGGVAGRGGPGGMPLGAVPGKGQGGEDEEHERPSFLREPDPEGVFGTDEITAPPVIGGQP